MNLRDVLRRINDECAKAGSQRAWASAIGVSTAYINDVINVRREPGAKILFALGLKKIVTYEPLDAEQHPDLSGPYRGPERGVFP